MYTITLDKHFSTWYYFTKNPEGGGFGSNNCGPKKHALAYAMRGMPPGARYVIVTNGKRSEEFVNLIGTNKV